MVDIADDTSPGLSLQSDIREANFVTRISFEPIHATGGDERLTAADSRLP